MNPRHQRCAMILAAGLSAVLAGCGEAAGGGSPGAVTPVATATPTAAPTPTPTAAAPAVATFVVTISPRTFTMRATAAQVNCVRYMEVSPPETTVTLSEMDGGKVFYTIIASTEGIGTFHTSTSKNAGVSLDDGTSKWVDSSGIPYNRPDPGPITMAADGSGSIDIGMSLYTSAGPPAHVKGEWTCPKLIPA